MFWGFLGAFKKLVSLFYKHQTWRTKTLKEPDDIVRLWREKYDAYNTVDSSLKYSLCFHIPLFWDMKEKPEPIQDYRTRLQTWS